MSKGSIAGTTTADQQKQIAMAMQQAAQQYAQAQAAMQQNAAYTGVYQGVTVVYPGHTHQTSGQVSGLWYLSPPTAAYPAGYIMPGTASGSPHNNAPLQGLYYTGMDARPVPQSGQFDKLLEPEFDLDEIERAQDLIDELT